MGVLWKIWFLMGSQEKPICLKGGGGGELKEFADLRRGLVKKRGLVFLRRAWYSNSHYDDKSFSSIFPKIPSEIICSKICWKHLLCKASKASFIYQQWTATVLIFLKVQTTDHLVFFSEYISRTAIDTSISN